MAAISPLRWLNRRLTSWLGETAPSIPPVRTVYGTTERKTLTEKQVSFTGSSTSRVNEILRMTLMGAGPGWWVSDHAEEAQHFTGWNYAAIHAKAKQAMMATARVYRKVPRKENKNITKSAANPDLPEYDREPLDEEHPAAKLLRKPNARWTAGIWRYMVGQQFNLTGTALIWKVRDKKGDLSELWIVPYALARPQMPTPAMPEGSYWVTATGLFTITGGFPTALGVGAMAGLTIDARDTHKIGWPHPVLQADNQSPLAAMSVQSDIAEEIDQAAWAVMHNAVDPSIILKLDANLQVDETALDAIEAKVNASRGGVPGKAKFWVIQGCDPLNIGRTPSELDYANSRPEARNAVLAGHGVAPVFCGVTEAGSYSAFFAALTQTIEITIQPELDMIASELTRLFQKEYKDDTLEVLITAKSFNDPEVTERRRQVNISARSVTINEDRKMMGLEPVPWGTVQIGTEIPPDLIDSDLFKPGVQRPDGTTVGEDITPEEPDDPPSGFNTGTRKPVPNRKPSITSKASLREQMDERMSGDIRERRSVEDKRSETIADITAELEETEEIFVRQLEEIPADTLRDRLDAHLLNGFYDV